jgi:hypothetical protein
MSPTQRPIPDNTQQTQQTSMPPTEFEPTILTSERPQTHALDRAATGIGNIYSFYVFVATAPPPPVGQGLLIHEVSRSHTATTTDGRTPLDKWSALAETSIWQHTTNITDRHPCPGGIRTHNIRKRAASDLRLTWHGHWDRQYILLYWIKVHTSSEKESSPHNRPWRSRGE